MSDIQKSPLRPIFAKVAIAATTGVGVAAFCHFKGDTDAVVSLTMGMVGGLIATGVYDRCTAPLLRWNILPDCLKRHI